MLPSSDRDPDRCLEKESKIVAGYRNANSYGPMTVIVGSVREQLKQLLTKERTINRCL